MTSDERSMNTILRVAGIILTVMGCLATYRGIFFLIPFAGLKYGLFMTCMGAVFAVAGIVMTVLTFRRAKKWKKALEEQQAAEQTDEAE